MLFQVFIYYRTSLQIFLFCKFFCKNISQVELESLGNSSTIFRSSHWRCSTKKAILGHFVIFTGKHLCWGLFFTKVAGHQACNFVKKRLQHRYFLANIRKFIRRPILKNICKRLHFWKVFNENVFQIRNQQKKLLMTCCVKDCSNQSKLNKNVSCNKVLGEEIKFLKKKRLNPYIRAKPQLLEKVLCKIR